MRRLKTFSQLLRRGNRAEERSEYNAFAEHGTAFRAVNLRYLDTPLSAVGSIKVGGRYNPKGAFEVLYLAENATTALKEVEFAASSGGRFAAAPKDPYVVFSVAFKVSKLADLSDPVTQSRLELISEDLVKPWRLLQARGELAPTQQLGAALREYGLEGFKYPSATDAAINLAIFPDRLKVDSFLEISWDGQMLARIEA